MEANMDTWLVPPRLIFIIFSVAFAGQGFLFLWIAWKYRKVMGDAFKIISAVSFIFSCLALATFWGMPGK